MAGSRMRRIAAAAAEAALALSRPDYFGGGARGEAAELRAELASDVPLVRKEAVKKVIAAMTLGKDVGSLFPDVLKNIQTDDLELKRLVYLYLSSHAASNPELVVLAVNTFAKDAGDARSASVRGLALRTLGCVRVPAVQEHLAEAVLRGLRDESSYVRRAAAQCASKAVAVVPALADDAGLADALVDMLETRESVPDVLAAAVCALREMGRLCVSAPVASRLAAALPDCGEWAQLSVLAALEERDADDDEERQRLVDAALPRLQHANAAVVLAAARVVLRHGADEARVRTRLSSGLVAVASSSQDEVAWLGVRALLLVHGAFGSHGGLLPAHASALFHVRFTDASFLKLAKLDLLAALARPENASELVAELCAVCRREVDAAVVRCAALSVSRVVQAVSSAAEDALHALVALARASPSLHGPALLGLARLSRVCLPDASWMDAAVCSALDAACVPAEDLLGEPEALAAALYLLGVHAAHHPGLVRDVGLPLFASVAPRPDAPAEAQTAALRLFAAGVVGRDAVESLLSGPASSLPGRMDHALLYSRLLERGESSCASVLAPSALDAPSDACRPGAGEPPHAALGALSSLLNADAAGRPVRLGRAGRPDARSGAASPALGPGAAPAAAALPDLLDLSEGAGGAALGGALRGPSPSVAVDLLAD